MFALRYFVKDVDLAVEFYGQTLGFTLVEQHGPAMAMLEKDGLNLWLAGPKSSAAQAITANGIVPNIGVNRLVLITDDLESQAEQLKAHGVTVRIATLQDAVGQQLIIQDPSGNYIELFQQSAAT